MFGHRYFGARFFGARFFGSAAPSAPPVQQGTTDAFTLQRLYVEAYTAGPPAVLAWPKEPPQERLGRRRKKRKKRGDVDQPALVAAARDGAIEGVAEAARIAAVARHRRLVMAALLA